MKKLITLAKELDFTTEIEYFDYCIDSHINGNLIQCEDLFEAMKKQDRLALIKYIDNSEIRNFYIDFSFKL